MEFKHISVLLDETIEGLNIKENGIYIDCTLGGGGHSLEIVKKIKSGRLICIDQDIDAIEAAKVNLKDYIDKITFVKSNFKYLPEILKELNIEKVDGILMDIGVSSYQIDKDIRGFSYIQNSELDMRMDQSQDLTARYIINNYSCEDLKNIFFKYGEENNETIECIENSEILCIDKDNFDTLLKSSLNLTKPSSSLIISDFFGDNTFTPFSSNFSIISLKTKSLSFSL